MSHQVMFANHSSSGIISCACADISLSCSTLKTSACFANSCLLIQKLSIVFQSSEVSFFAESFDRNLL